MAIAAVLVTLLAFFAEDARKRGRNETRAETFAAVPGYSEWHKSGPPILPLPILDFSSDAVSLNLPVVIGQNLARLVEALEASHGNVGARSFEVLASRKALDAFHQSAALVKRDLLSAPSVDHDAVLEREHSRISIPKNFAKLCRAIADDFFVRYGTRPIFLCSIDDLDLTSGQALELLSWVRDLVSANALWLLAGDLDHLRLEVTRALHRLHSFGTESERTRLLPETFDNALITYREDLLEKCIPPSHRCELHTIPFTSHICKTLNKEDIEILQQWRPAGVSVRTMRDFVSFYSSKTDSLQMIQFFAQRMCKSAHHRKSFASNLKATCDGVAVMPYTEESGPPIQSWRKNRYKIQFISVTGMRYALTDGSQLEPEVGRLVALVCKKSVRVPLLEVSAEGKVSRFAEYETDCMLSTYVDPAQFLGSSMTNDGQEADLLLRIISQMADPPFRQSLKSALLQVAPPLLTRVNDALVAPASPDENA